MSVSTPHFLLFSKSSRGRSADQPGRGRWHFLIESTDGSAKLEATDSEPDVAGERLELLAVVRGLEALDQPSRVTLVTPSRYVSRGLRYGLPEWSDSGWRWERFGRLVPVKNHDLWKRVERALRFHHVECRTLEIDESDDQPCGRSRELQTARSPSHAATHSEPESRFSRHWLTGLCRSAARLRQRLGWSVSAHLPTATPA